MNEENKPIDIPVRIEKPKIWEKIIPAHKKVARLVTEKDVERVVEDTKILYEICLTGAYAMAH
ncbi:MAG: hypothetical protein AABY22_18645, partial [Nanoarchaeota archaeon]